jgi:hypothetical protein
MCLTSSELFRIALASLIEFLFSSVEELKLGFFDADLCLDAGDFSFEDRDFVLSLIICVDVVGDAAVKGNEGVSELLFLLFMESISLSLLGYEVLADLAKETSYVLEWGLALDLKGDCVKDLLAELVLLELAQLCEDREGRLGGLLQEHCVGREGDVEDQDDHYKSLGHLYQNFFVLRENNVFFS